jgi:hypothetical protein
MSNTASPPAEPGAYLDDSYVTGATYNWTVPTVTSSQKNCLIKVNGYNSSGSLVSYDRSDKVFKIEVVMVRAHQGEDLP